MFREFKTSSRIKQEVNFVFTYKGMEFDKIDQLSGGERDRISLMLTLAINKVSGCPFLFLDESISTLDSSKKDDAIRAIRGYSTGKTVVLVCHSSVNGVFDHTLDL